MKKPKPGMGWVIVMLILMLLALGFISFETRHVSLNESAAATTPDSSLLLAPQAPPLPGTTLRPQPRPQTGKGIQSIDEPIPRTGDQELLVILVDFSDRPGLFSGQTWQQYFFDTDGFADYFKETSYDQLRYTGDVVGMSAGVPVVNSPGIAYLRLPHPITYYASGLYGFGTNFPQNNGGVVYHTLQALDAAGFDFSPYANATNNKVESLVVVFAGRNYGFTSDAINSLEATGYQLTDAGSGPYTSTGGQIFDNYTFCPGQGRLSGQMAFIGICAHEHGHSLGISDLYDLSLTTSGIGQFGLMGYGTYGATDGQRPFHFGAFSKEFVGWINPSVVSMGTTTTVTLNPAESGPNFIKLSPYGFNGRQEYFLLENRQALGFDQDWLTNGLCTGLLIWHIDQYIVQNYPYAVNKPLGAPGAPLHQGVILVEADGDLDLINPPYTFFGECSDTWNVGQTWDDNSTPNSRLWDGSSSGLAVTILSQSNNSVTLRISVERATLPNKIFLPGIQN